MYRTLNPITALAIAGEEIRGFVNSVISLADGSNVYVSTDKPSFYAGETITGRVVAQINSPIPCDQVTVSIECVEHVQWDTERSESIKANPHIPDGQPGSEARRTIYHHNTYSSHKVLFAGTVIASTIPATLMVCLYPRRLCSQW